MLVALFLLIIDVLFAVTGQLLLKKSVSLQGEVDFSIAQLLAFFLGVLSRWQVWVALTCYGVAFLLWLMVLSKLKLSLAYPFTALMYVLLLFTSWYFFDEQITASQIIGVGLILAGLLFVSRAV
ncbi:MAG: SMR family transporter [Patescibacteria group bacterium]